MLIVYTTNKKNLVFTSCLLKLFVRIKSRFSLKFGLLIHLKSLLTFSVSLKGHLLIRVAFFNSVVNIAFNLLIYNILSHVFFVTSPLQKNYPLICAVMSSKSCIFLLTDWILRFERFTVQRASCWEFDKVNNWLFISSVMIYKQIE